MKSIQWLLPFLSVLLLDAKVIGNRVEKVGPVTTVNTSDPVVPPVLSVEKIGPALRLDTRDDTKPPVLGKEVIGPRFTVDTRNLNFDFYLSGALVLENQPSGTFVGQFQAIGIDGIAYSLEPKGITLDHLYFSLSPSGRLTTAKIFDFEKVQVYEISVSASLPGYPTISQDFIIQVLDQPESDPSGFALSNDSVRENLPVRSKVGQFTMQDGGWAEFVLVKGEGDRGNEYFTLTPDGELRTATILDRSSDGATLSIRVRAYWGPSAIGLATPYTDDIFEISILANPVIPPPPPPPFDPWKKKWEEATLLLAQLEDQVEEKNATLLIKTNLFEEKQREKSTLCDRIEDLNHSISEAHKHNQTVEKSLADKEIELAQARKQAECLVLDIANSDARNRELDVQWEKINSLLSEANHELVTLEEKADVPHLRGWHYTLDQGWLWTDHGYYPLVYSYDRDAWLEYDQGTSDPWHYFDHSSKTWFEWASSE
jgi:hypothetical protein